MAEARVRVTDTESISSDNSGVNKYGLDFYEIREEKIQEEGQDRKRQRKDKTEAFCDVCLMHNLNALCKNVAFYLCCLCEQYVCDKCFKGHESHNYIKLLSEKSERDGQIESFLDEMMNESEREEVFERENVSMVDRVNVKHVLDQDDCIINGLCGLNYTRWVVCDNYNYCIKIFNIGSNLLQRCIRLGSAPWGVTEIKLKSEPTEQVVITNSDISVKNPAEPIQSILAVTLPFVRRILIIDVTQNPAVIIKLRETEKFCFSIDFSGDSIFTVCNDDLFDDGYHYCVSVMSTDGDTIKTINTYLYGYWSIPYLAVFPGRFYITDPGNHKVLCMNNKGKVVSHKTIGWSMPRGISVDPNTNHVYICARDHEKLYRLNSSLESSEPLFDFKSINSENPKALCLYRDKLYVSHDLGSTHGNFVTVVRVL